MSILNILHNSQIGFVCKNRTAHQVLTSRTLVDKYVHHNDEKIYALFCGLQKKLLAWRTFILIIISVAVFLSLLKSLYSNATCSIKICQNQTWPFPYRHKRSCILSSLQFNLFINDIPFSFEKFLPDHFVLPNGAKLNPLLYADDLVILSRSNIGLQNYIKTISIAVEMYRV